MDQDTYDKHAKHAPGHGYEARKVAPSSIVVHSTSSSTRNTAFSAEAQYLYDASLVSAHYLIGRDGAVVRFLDPKLWAAWHAGQALSEWANQCSIGVELHHSVGDPPYPQAQLDALAALLRSLMALFNIPVHMIETHGQIALPGPYQRKHDPGGWSYSDFLEWRSHLAPEVPTPAPPPAPVARAYRVRGGVPVYEAANRQGKLWGFLALGEEVVIDDPADGHLADGRGFVDVNGLVAK